MLDQAFQRASGQVRREVRKELDAEVLPLLKECYDAAAESRQRSSRHFDKLSILRLLTETLGGMLPATQMRAAYATILDQSGPMELARYAQWAVDTGDPVLADAVIRANNEKAVGDRGFLSQTVLEALPNSEYDELQAACSSIVLVAEQAGLTWSEFENDRPDAMRRIAVGLRKQLQANDPNVIEGATN